MITGSFASFAPIDEVGGSMGMSGASGHGLLFGGACSCEMLPCSGVLAAALFSRLKGTHPVGTRSKPIFRSVSGVAPV